MDGYAFWVLLIGIKFSVIKFFVKLFEIRMPLLLWVTFFQCFRLMRGNTDGHRMRVAIKFFWTSQWVGNWGAHNAWVCGLNHIWNSLLDWCLDGLCLLEASANCAKLLGQDHFAELNQHVVTTERAREVHQKSLGLGTNLSFFGGDSEFRAVLCVCLNL
jgi:hypothetical protein